MGPMSQVFEAVTGVTRVWRVRHTQRDCASPIVVIVILWCTIPSGSAAAWHHVTRPDPSQILRQCHFTMAALFSSVLFVYFTYPFYFEQYYVLGNLILYLELCKSAGFSTSFWYSWII